jgi:signal transduction histidine kinase
VSEVVEVRSLIVVPLVAREQKLGTLVLGRTDRTYEDNEVVFAEEIGRRAALAFDTARLYAAQQNARDAADAASRAKDQFLASVSHELRTPLSAILGWAKLLALDDLPESKRARARGTIERNAVAMAQLIEDLIDVSRIVSGKLRLEMGNVDPALVVDAAVEALRPAAEARAIEVAVDHDARLGAVLGDAARLQQVVWNLLSNAVKFTPAGGRVHVELRRSANQVLITIRDTGKGIDPRFLPHVFEPFRQGDALVTRPTSGLGLGLAIVKHIVELHGGRAEAYSEGVGRGAVFTVHLPVPAQRSAQPVAPSPRVRAEARPELLGLRVLVVEDEADMRQLLEEVLTSCGSRVVATRSVAEAMDRFDMGDIPDVLISDIGMEGESGFDLIRRVRERPPSKGGRVPAAALTAYTRAEDRRDVLGAGFELHMRKPIEPEELVSMVATLAKFAVRK